MEMRWLFTINLFIIQLFMPFHSVHGQTGDGRNNAPDKDIGFIQWMAQYPLPSAYEQDKFGQKLVRFIFGKDERIILLKPVSLLARDTSDYWILDQGNGALFHIRQQVGEIPHFKNKEIKDFPSLVGICALPEDKLLFTDSYLNKIFLSSPSSKTIRVFNDSIDLDRPTGIAYNPVYQQVWVVETTRHCITVLNLRGQILKRIGQRGVGQGEFNFPTYIWIDKFGKIFIVDSMNFRIQVFSADGEFITAFGKIGDVSGSFARPRGIATDSDGNIYVVDALFNTVQIFDTEGHFLYNFGSQGRENGNFWMPAGIFIDQHDFIYVADTYNSRVQVFRYNKRGLK